MAAPTQSSFNKPNEYNESIKYFENLYLSTENAEIREEITNILKLIEESVLVVSVNIRRKRQIETPSCFFYQVQLKNIQNQKDVTQLNLSKLHASLNTFREKIAVYEVKVKESSTVGNQSVLNGLRRIAITIQNLITKLQENLTKLQDQESFSNGKIVIYCSTTSTTTTFKPSTISSTFAFNTTIISTTSPEISTSTIATKPLEQCGKFFNCNLFF